MTDAARNTKELPRLGRLRRTLRKFMVGRSDLFNAQSHGKLRRPMIVAGGRAAWYDTDIKDYLARLGGELEAIAVSDPDKLLPEQIEDAAVKLSARLMTNVLGEKVSRRRRGDWRRKEALSGGCRDSRLHSVAGALGCNRRAHEHA